MKHALVNGQLTPATSSAPAMATCPNCGGSVKLRHRQGTYFWRHVQLPRGGCRPSNPESVVTGDDRKRWTRRAGDLTPSVGVESLSDAAAEGELPQIQQRSEY